MFKTFAFTAIVAAVSAAEWGPVGYGVPHRRAPHQSRSYARPARPHRSFAKPSRPHSRGFSAPRLSIDAPRKGSFGHSIQAPSRHSFSAPKRQSRHLPDFQGAVKKQAPVRREKKQSLHGVELRYPGAGYAYNGPFTGGRVAQPHLNLDHGRHSQYGQDFGYGGRGTGPRLDASRLHRGHD